MIKIYIRVTVIFARASDIIHSTFNFGVVTYQHTSWLKTVTAQNCCDDCEQLETTLMLYWAEPRTTTLNSWKPVGRSISKINERNAT